jgi:uncharacterized DUF497 family protein
MHPSYEEFSSFEWDEEKRRGEVRALAICPESQRLIVVYTMRGETCRIISAPRGTSK